MMQSLPQPGTAALPLFEDDAVALSGVDRSMREFVEAMRKSGGGVIDLGETGRRLCDEAVAQTDPGFARRGASRIQDAWRQSPAVAALARLPIIHQHLQAAYGRKSFAFQTLNFRQGSQQSLHSDLIHFSSFPERFMCGVWIALEDVKADSGPLVYYPGSHRLPTLSMRDVGVNSDTPTPEDYERHYVPRFSEAIMASGLPKRELLIRKGQAFVWAANLAHGGSAISQPSSTRRSLVVHCYFDKGLYFTPMVSDVEGRRLKVRLPPDVSSGGWRWPRGADGRRVAVAPKTVVAAMLRELINRPIFS